MRCSKSHNLVPTGLPSFTSYYFLCYNVCCSNSKLHTLAVCSCCSHSLEFPFLAYALFLPAQLLLAPPRSPTLAPPSSGLSVSLTNSVLWVCVSFPRDCWLLESWGTAGTRVTADLGPLCAAPGRMATRTPQELIVFTEVKDDTTAQLPNCLCVEGSRENYRVAGKHKTEGIYT